MKHNVQKQKDRQIITNMESNQDESQIEVLEQYPAIAIRRTLPIFETDILLMKQIGTHQDGQHLIFLEYSAFELMLAHTQKYAKQGEVGGLLIGNFCFDGNISYTWIQAAIPAEDAKSSSGSLQFTPDAIELVEQKRELNFPQSRFVGWYHSHPGFGIFLSGIDLHTHRTVFKDGPFVAMVLDPIRREEGIFDWIDKDEIKPASCWLIERIKKS